MTVEIEKGSAHGTVKAPPSKSVCHRLIICAALSDGESRLSGISLCADTVATINCLRALGAEIILSNDSLTVCGNGIGKINPSAPLDCNESGSTLRFLIPLALLTGKETIFVGSNRLMERPLDIYEDICREKGFKFEKGDGGIKLCGRLEGGEYSVSGNISSQFITGLMLALSKCRDDSEIIITTDIESKSYIDLTIDAMRSFGAEAAWKGENVIFIKGNSPYKARELTVEGDFSGSAFIEALNLFGGQVSTLGLRENSLQGDRVYRELFPLLDKGAAEISLKDCPDLGPILFAVAAAKNGARFTDTRRLGIKESDRAAVMAEELAKFGARVNVFENSVVIEKTRLHKPTEPLKGHNDHRIVMALSVLLTLFGGRIEGAEAVKKSYEGFFEDLKNLNITVRKHEV